MAYPHNGFELTLTSYGSSITIEEADCVILTKGLVTPRYKLLGKPLPPWFEHVKCTSAMDYLSYSNTVAKSGDYIDEAPFAPRLNDEHYDSLFFEKVNDGHWIDINFEKHPENFEPNFNFQGEIPGLKVTINLPEREDDWYTWNFGE